MVLGIILSNSYAGTLYVFQMQEFGVFFFQHFVVLCRFIFNKY